MVHPTDGYGAPEYAISQGIVFLRGVLDGDVATAGVPALPPEACPATKQRLRLDASTGGLLGDMKPNGRINTFGGGVDLETTPIGYVVFNNWYTLG